jgi:hypothetical protein
MSAPQTVDEFNRFLSIECPLERSVSLGLAFEEIIEKLRTKGTKPSARRSSGFASCRRLAQSN